jgi:hypothetical protein
VSSCVRAARSRSARDPRGIGRCSVGGRMPAAPPPHASRSPVRVVVASSRCSSTFTAWSRHTCDLATDPRTSRTAGFMARNRGGSTTMRASSVRVADDLVHRACSVSVERPVDHRSDVPAHVTGLAVSRGGAGRLRPPDRCCTMGDHMRLTDRRRRVPEAVTDPQITTGRSRRRRRRSSATTGAPLRRPGPARPGAATPTPRVRRTARTRCRSGPLRS